MINQDVKWPNRIIVVRHGQSEQNQLLDLLEIKKDPAILSYMKKIRDADIPLTSNGILQATGVGKYLAGMGQLDVCFSSPYLRTIQTAQNILAQLPYPLKLYEDSRIREKEFGRLHGFTTEEIQEKYPEEFEDREREGKYYYRLPRGENYPDVEMRVHSFLEKLSRNFSGLNVLVVTHYVPYVCFRTMFEHLGEKEIIGLGSVPNCGIEIFDIDTTKHPSGRMRLSEFNKVVYDESLK